MKRPLLLLLLLVAALNVHSQVNYEPGYIVDNNGEKTEVLILNKDWRDNPSTFTYKLSEEGESKRADINELKEFGIGDYVRYKKFLAAIDRSNGQVKKLSNDSEPVFERERVFLKQLIDGDADLYSYQQGTLERFFYATGDSDPEPLIYKEYRKGNRIAANNQFRQQLFSKVNCEFPAEQFRNMRYRKKEMVQYFEDYNACQNSEYKLFEEEGAGLRFHFRIKGGVEAATMAVEKGHNISGTTFDLGNNIIAGLEAEMVLPFNRNKWSVFIEPLYKSQQIDAQYVNKSPHGETHASFVSMDLTSISTMAGARHYFFLEGSSSIFINAGAVYDFPVNSELLIDLDNERYELDPELEDLETRLYFNFGAGFSYLNRITAEIRYSSPKTVIGYRNVPTFYVLDWKSTISSVSVLLSYRIF